MLLNDCGTGITAYHGARATQSTHGLWCGCARVVPVPVSGRVFGLVLVCSVLSVLGSTWTHSPTFGL